MKKYFIFASILFVFCACDTKTNDDPSAKEDEKSLYVAGVYKDSLNQEKIYLCEDQFDVYTDIMGSNALLRSSGSDMYMMVLNSNVCSFYKDTTLRVTVPFYAMDFFVEGSVITAVGAATLDKGFPTSTSEYNAVDFNSASESIGFLDNNDQATSKATYVTKYNGKSYIGGYGLVTSASPKPMSWINYTYNELGSLQYTSNIVLQNGKFVVVGSKTFEKGKSIVAIIENGVETILSDTATASSSSVYLSNVLDAKVINEDLYICATENFNSDIRVIIWKNGKEFMIYPSTSWAIFTVKGTELFTVTKGRMPERKSVVEGEGGG